MTRKSKFAAAALAATLSLGILAGAVGPSFAQMGPGGPGGHGGKHHAHFQGQRADRIDGRIAFLKAELKITQAQQGKWDDFEKVLRANAAERKAQAEKIRAERQAQRAEFQQKAEAAKAAGQTVQRPERKQASAVEKMEMRQKMMKAHLENQEKVLDAFKPLYASLSDDQKKTADDLFGRGFGGHRGGPGHGHGPRGR
ncbi:MAG: Spy/CpxP family protein refolding chaperone [Rhodospirillales bacterium]|nr:Spy/CpxP family protein refolding chaperone [Rhodospirillales bacterium]